MPKYQRITMVNKSKLYLQYSSINEIVKQDAKSLDVKTIQLLQVYSFLANALDNFYFTNMPIRAMSRELGISRGLINQYVKWLIDHNEIIAHATEINLFKLN